MTNPTASSPKQRRLAPIPLKHIWPVMGALLTLGGLYIGVGTALSPGPRGLILALVISFLALYAVFHRRGEGHILHHLTRGLLVLLTVAIVLSVSYLLVDVTTHRSTASTLLRDAGLIWLANVLTFACWYWALDGGGPSQRHHHGYGALDLVFPQLSLQSSASSPWQPVFVDYLFLAFNTSTAFSPTDTAILSRHFKALTMLQALLSLVVTGVLLARAINTL